MISTGTTESQAASEKDRLETQIAGLEWPTFGWSDDIRPALARALAAGRSSVLATLYRVDGSAPRGPGAQMLFDGEEASGYFSGDCIESDLFRHAGEVLRSGQARRLHYGTGSPWIDIRLRCGGALHIQLERVAADSEAARGLLDHAENRLPCLWQSNGEHQAVDAIDGAGHVPLLTFAQTPFVIRRRHDPPRRLVVSGSDPAALAIARLASLAGFETWLVRPDAPGGASLPPPPFPLAGVLRLPSDEALRRLGPDRWTAYLGASHQDEHEIAACLAALKGGAGYVGLIGARSRAAGRLALLDAHGANRNEVARLRLSPGVTGLGKAPFAVATGVLAEVMRALNPEAERA